MFLVVVVWFNSSARFGSFVVSVVVRLNSARVLFVCFNLVSRSLRTFGSK